MNPFDLPDLQFLAFYGVLFIAALVAAGRLRHRLRQPSDEPTEEAQRIGAYEIAYLFGGKQCTINAVIVRLVRDGVLAMDVMWRRLMRTSKLLPGDAADLERAVYAAVPQNGVAVWRLRWATWPEFAPLKRRLQELGLLVVDDWAARVFPFAILLVVLVIGVIKYFVGFSSDVAPGFLVSCWLMSGFMAIGGFAVPLGRSRRGDLLLVKLRDAHAELASRAMSGADKLTGNELALIVSLFGMRFLNDSPLPELPKVLANSQPMRLESHGELWAPILVIPVFGGLFVSIPLVGTPAEDNLLSTFWIVVIVYAFFSFGALMLSVPRLEELVRREAWVPPGTAAYPVPVALALCAVVMAATAGVMLLILYLVHLFGG